MDLEILKFILVGCSGSGKTSIIHRFIYNTFKEGEDATIGLSTAVKEVTLNNGTNVKICVWDTTGQENYRSIVGQYFRDASAVIAVYDITDRESFKRMTEWVRDAKELAPSDAAIVVVANKADISENQDFDSQEGRKYAAQEKLAFMTTSAKINVGINELFSSLAEKTGGFVLRTSLRHVATEECHKYLAISEGVAGDQEEFMLLVLKGHS